MEPTQEGSAQGLDLYWHIAVRRRWWIIVPFVIGWAAVLGACWVIPPKFKSESLIMVEQQRVSTEYVTPNVTQDISARMNALTEKIMSRTNLLDIAKKYDLYSASKANVDTDLVADKLRKDISIDLQRSASTRPDQLTAFKLSYINANPEIANKVTQELTSLFIDTSMKHAADVAKQTDDFLHRQLDLAQQDLDAQEKKMREFKTQNLGELPEQLTSNLQILTGLQSRMQSATEALSRAEQQRTYLESLRDRYRAATTAGATSPDAPVTAAAIDLQLEKLHQQLADLQAKYTDKHPDVIRTKNEIAVAEAMKAKIEKQVATGQTSNKPKSPQQLQAEAPLMQIESQLKANEIEIANDRAEIKSINGQIGQYQGRLNSTPMREQQLAAIIRDHEQSQKNYDELLKKTQQSGLATNLLSEQQGEQFKLIDPPSMPTKPYSPDRSKMALLGIGIGLALGVVIAGLVELSDLHVYTEGQVKEIVGATMMIVGVPSLWTPSEIHLNRRSAVMQAALAGVIVLAVSGITAFTFIKG